MGSEIFIARRLGRGDDSERGAGVVVKIAVATVAVSIAVMVVAVAVMAGFRSEIEGRLARLGALAVMPQKTALIRTGQAVQGVVIKGVSADTIGARTLFVSPSLARTMSLVKGDRVEVLMAGNAPRRALFVVGGEFSTGLEELDKTLVITELRTLEKYGAEVSTMTGVPEIDHPQLTDWLATHNINTAVIITIMVIVALIAILAAMLVIVLERIKTIGILKTLGMRNGALRRVFLWRAAAILALGLAIGNVVGIGLATMQKTTGAVPLDEGEYFLSAVPIALDWWSIVALNAGAIVVILAAMTIPVSIIARITPEKSIRYE